ncbi:hypothetical protein FB451DRAFT_1236858 [Mycena latifolia]|nr:hypothetical protein FB451DRAFT_1236858 [Mycena latifolia]
MVQMGAQNTLFLCSRLLHSLNTAPAESVGWYPFVFINELLPDEQGDEGNLLYRAVYGDMFCLQTSHQQSIRLSIRLLVYVADKGNGIDIIVFCVRPRFNIENVDAPPRVEKESSLDSLANSRLPTRRNSRTTTLLVYSRTVRSKAAIEMSSNTEALSCTGVDLSASSVSFLSSGTHFWYTAEVVMSSWTASHMAACEVRVPRKLMVVLMEDYRGRCRGPTGPHNTVFRFFQSKICINIGLGAPKTP